jgi:hypothetical protein
VKLKFAEQCCDAMGYLELGRQCAQNLNHCWDPLRTIGATVYYAVPFFLGLPPETVLVFNFLLLFFSIYLATRVVHGFLQLPTTNPTFTWFTAGIIAALPHVLFMWGCARHALTDVPAGSLILIGLWLMVLSIREKTYLLSYAGLLFSCGALMRPFYLYLVFLVAVVYSGFQLAMLKMRAIKAVAIFLLCLLLPLGFQYLLTYNNTKQWSFMEKNMEANVIKASMSFGIWGYDTLLPGVSLRFTDPYTQNGQGGVIDAWHKHDFVRVAVLFAKKENFYFGSWVPLNYVYIRSAKERIFSPLILVVNILAFAGFFYFGLARGRWKVFFMPMLAAGLIWAQCVIMHPEARYMVVVYVLTWVMAGLNINLLFPVKKND